MAIDIHKHLTKYGQAGKINRYLEEALREIVDRNFREEIKTLSAHEMRVQLSGFRHGTGFNVEFPDDCFDSVRQHSFWLPSISFSVRGGSTGLFYWDYSEQERELLAKAINQLYKGTHKAEVVNDKENDRVFVKVSTSIQIGEFKPNLRTSYNVSVYSSEDMRKITTDVQDSWLALQATSRKIEALVREAAEAFNADFIREKA